MHMRVPCFIWYNSFTITLYLMLLNTARLYITQGKQVLDFICVSGFIFKEHLSMQKEILGKVAILGKPASIVR